VPQKAHTVVVFGSSRPSPHFFLPFAAAGAALGALGTAPSFVATTYQFPALQSHFVCCFERNVDLDTDGSTLSHNRLIAKIIWLDVVWVELLCISEMQCCVSCPCEGFQGKVLVLLLALLQLEKRVSLLACKRVDSFLAQRERSHITRTIFLQI